MDPAAVAAAAAPALVAAAAQFNFATSPGQHLADRSLNMGNADDKKLYFNATERLTTKEDLFNLEPEHRIPTCHTQYAIAQTSKGGTTTRLGGSGGSSRYQLTQRT
jgi:hypothetical protein